MKRILFTTFVCSHLVVADYWDKSIRKSSAPYITGDSFRQQVAQHIYDEATTTLKPELVFYADIIFIKSEYLEQFFKQVHPKIVHPYIILTHNSDMGVPGKFMHYLDDEKILMWFGQNPTVNYHSKFRAIPIGIANQYVFPHGQIATFDKILKNLPALEKKYLLGINFRPSTAPHIRNEVYKYFSKIPYCKNIGVNNHEQYLIGMAQTKFIVSPPGNGLDCHRHWEAMMVHTYPIILSSCLDEILVDMPVLIVKSWQEITEPFLHEKYIELENKYKSFNLDKIYLSYWETMIKGYQETFRDR